LGVRGIGGPSARPGIEEDPGSGDRFALAVDDRDDDLSAFSKHQGLELYRVEERSQEEAGGDVARSTGGEQPHPGGRSSQLESAVFPGEGLGRGLEGFAAQEGEILCLGKRQWMKGDLGPGQSPSLRIDQPASDSQLLGGQAGGRDKDQGDA
jgi:hypothetical protein